MGGLSLFETPIGPCGIVWTQSGVRAVQLPEGSAEATLMRLQRRCPGVGAAVFPAQIACAIAAIVELLSAGRSDLNEIRLDDSEVSDFDRRVHAATRMIPAGRTSTYGELARGFSPALPARAVGQALGRNPFPLIVPCHRVLAANGLGGFSAAGGGALKRRLLAIEGLELPWTADLFD